MLEILSDKFHLDCLKPVELDDNLTQYLVSRYPSDTKEMAPNAEELRPQPSIERAAVASTNRPDGSSASDSPTSVTAKEHSSLMEA